jgi:hypothetical protein
MPSGLQEFDKAFVLMKKEKAGAGFFLQAHSAMLSAQMPSALLNQEMAQTSPALAEAA